MKNYVYVLVIMLASISYPVLACDCFNEHQRAAEQFKQLDTNEDGFVSKGEVQAQPEFTRYMYSSIYGGFELGDINSDGFLDSKEFLANEESLSI